MSLSTRLDRLEARVGERRIAGDAWILLLAIDLDSEALGLAAGGPAIERRPRIEHPALGDAGGPMVALRVPSHAHQGNFRDWLSPDQRAIFDRAADWTAILRDGGSAGRVVVVHHPPLTPAQEAESTAEADRLEAEGQL